MYTDMFGNLTQQVKIVKLFSQLEEERMELCKITTPSSPVSLDNGP